MVVNKKNMTSYEILTLLISTLAVFVAVISLIRTRSISEKQLKLEKITAELSKKQLQQIKEKELAEEKAYIDVEFVDSGDNNQIILTNHGYSEAKDVKLKIYGEYNPLIPSEYEEKFPVKLLRPGKFVTLWAADEFGTPDNYEIEVSWIDPDGSKKIDKQHIHLN